jgi:hypothetical protein
MIYFFLAKISGICFYHLRRLRQLRRSLSHKALVRLVTALVLGRLDYCNSVLAGLPACTLAPLQRVQNAAARLVLDIGRQSSISAALKQLHWLPVKFRT